MWHEGRVRYRLQWLRVLEMSPGWLWWLQTDKNRNMVLECRMCGKPTMHVLMLQPNLASSTNLLSVL